MSITAQEILEALYVPTRLVVNPTDLSAVHPHGGTSIGIVRDVLLEVAATQLDVEAEEFGFEVVDTVEGGESWRLTAALHGFNLAAFQQVFLEAAAGGVSGSPYVVHPAPNRRAGRLRSSDGVKLLSSPKDSRHPAVLFRVAIPRRAAPMRVRFGLRSQLLWTASWVALRDSAGDGDAVQLGKLSDLTLT